MVGELRILLLVVIGIIPLSGKAAAISAKLDRVEFEDTPLSDAIEYLRIKSRELDAGGAGVNFLIDPEVDLEAPITLHLGDVSIGTAVLCLVDHARLDYRVDNHACLILPAGKGELAKKSPHDPEKAARYAPAIRARDYTMDQVEFAEAPLKDVVKYLSDRFHSDHPSEPPLNLVVSSRIDGNIPVTMKMNSAPASRVLYFLSKMTGIEIRIEPYAIFLDPPGTRQLHLARVEHERKKKMAAQPNRKRGKGYTLGTPPNDPRSPAHPDYVHSAHSQASLRTNALNNVYKWVSGKWTFVRHGSGDTRPSALDTNRSGLTTSRLQPAR